jgi:Ca2+:H+ antiporter
VIIATIALLVPAAFQNLVGGLAGETVKYDLSVTIAIVLLLLYGLNLLFSLHTHRSLFTRETPGGPEKETEGAPSWTVRTSLLYLVGASALIAWMSELLVGSVEQAAQSLGVQTIRWYYHRCDRRQRGRAQHGDSNGNEEQDGLEPRHRAR